MRHSIPGIKAVMILTAATLMTSACQRDPQRSGQSDAATEPRTGAQGTTPTAERGDQPGSIAGSQDLNRERADAFVGGEDIRRDPASAGAPSGAIDPGLPRDEKGIVGSPHASNLPATGDVADHELGAEQYSYEDREEFKSFLEARLQGVGRALEAMDRVAIPRDPASAETQTENLQLRQQEVDRLKSEHDRITQSLEQIEHVPAQSWEQVRDSLVDDVTKFEQDYQAVLQSAREGGES
jgi:hypothetical protein